MNNLTAKELSEIYEEIERYLIASLKRNLLRHKKWEKSLGFEWPAWQAEKIKSIERFRRENESIIEEYRDIISTETRKMLLEQFAEGEKKVLEELVGDSDLAAGVTDDSFFEIFDEKIESLIEEVQGKETMAEKSALRMMDDVYRQTIIKADLAVQTGSMTVQQAVELAVKDFARQGINSIEYRDGRRVNIADYAYMALQTSNTRAGLYGAAKQRAALGIDTVRVSQYHACSPTCQPWQGKIYIDDVYGVFDGEIYGDKGKSKNGKWYMLLSVAVKSGLFHPNCRHTLTSYREREDARESLPIDDNETRRRYKLEQQQRALERKVRKWKRMLEGSDDPVWQDAYKKKVREAQKDLREFIKENSDVLRRDPWREKIYKDSILVKGKSATGNADNEGRLPQKTGTVDFSDESAIIKSLNEKKLELEQCTYEVDRTITTDGIVWDTKGVNNAVHPEQIEQLGSSLQGSYSYHNHPEKETRFSFSSDDVSFFLHYKNKYSAASDFIYEYEMIATPDTVFADFDTVKSDFENYYRNNVWRKSFEGEIDIDVDGYHEVLLYLSQKYHFVYRRIKRND